MGRSQETFSKKEHEKKKIQKRKEKEEKREERKANSKKGKSFEDMIAYVDENGQLTSTPPDPNKKKVLNFSMKEFDELFFEYFNRKNDPNITLTKTEFYNYTVQIATFSDRLAHLYPDQKEIAATNKEKWLPVDS